MHLLISVPHNIPNTKKKIPFLFLAEIDAIQAGKQAEKERKKREKTKIVGDLHPMLNALPTLEELIAQANKPNQNSKKGTGSKKQKAAKKDL